MFAAAFRLSILTLAPLLMLCAPDAFSRGVTLEWTDNSNNESGFIVERSRDGQRFKQLATLGENTTRFADQEAREGERYWYRVRAFNAYGRSGFVHSGLIEVGGPPPPAWSNRRSRIRGNMLNHDFTIEDFIGLRFLKSHTLREDDWQIVAEPIWYRHGQGVRVELPLGDNESVFYKVTKSR